MNRILLIAAAVLTVLMSGCTTLQSGTSDDDFNADNTYEKIGTVEEKAVNWNWFFSPGEAERTNRLEENARKKAEAEYGKDIILRTESVSGSWNPASLLMLFSTLGYVEDAEISISVWKKRPEPEPAAADIHYGIRYVVIPEEDYTTPSEFMIVEYRTREQLEDELYEQLEQGKFSEEDLEKRQARLPETGRVFITLGREDISNAISRWFTFTCTYGDETVFRKTGTEDIPYVYGTDRLWWNDKSYDINLDWDGELVLTAEDSYQHKTYNFRIVRERYIIEE